MIPQPPTTPLNQSALNSGIVSSQNPRSLYNEARGSMTAIGAEKSRHPPARHPGIPAAQTREKTEKDHEGRNRPLRRDLHDRFEITARRGKRGNWSIRCCTGTRRNCCSLAGGPLRGPGELLKIESLAPQLPTEEGGNNRSRHPR